jgi:ParB-like chromosome segregation protein Spo0J
MTAPNVHPGVGDRPPSARVQVLPARGTVELLSLPIDQIVPCPFQPRVTVSVRHVRKLAASMSAGRHDPVLEVERLPGTRSKFQIICGEQRWRAARAAGLRHVLAQVHPPMDPLSRLRKQYEENRLREDLDPIEEAHSILMHKTLADIQVAESWLRAKSLPFKRLADERVRTREGFALHLDDLVGLIQAARGRAVGGLSPWRETERALGISETNRKAKVGLLRLPAEVQERLRRAPAEHAAQVSRLTDAAQQRELTDRLQDLTHDDLRVAVNCLLQNPAISVADAVERLAPGSARVRDGAGLDEQLTRLVDLCRQLSRLARNLAPRLTASECDQVNQLVAALCRDLDICTA